MAGAGIPVPPPPRRKRGFWETLRGIFHSIPVREAALVGAAVGDAYRQSNPALPRPAGAPDGDPHALTRAALGALYGRELDGRPLGSPSPALPPARPPAPRPTVPRPAPPASAPASPPTPASPAPPVARPAQPESLPPPAADAPSAAPALAETPLVVAEPPALPEAVLEDAGEALEVSAEDAALFDELDELDRLARILEELPPLPEETWDAVWARWEAFNENPFAEQVRQQADEKTLGKLLGKRPPLAGETWEAYRARLADPIARLRPEAREQAESAARWQWEGVEAERLRDGWLAQFRSIEEHDGEEPRSLLVQVADALYGQSPEALQLRARGRGGQHDAGTALVTLLPETCAVLRWRRPDLAARVEAIRARRLAAAVLAVFAGSSATRRARVARRAIVSLVMCHRHLVAEEGQIEKAIDVAIGEGKLRALKLKGKRWIEDARPRRLAERADRDEVEPRALPPQPAQAPAPKAGTVGRRRRTARPGDRLRSPSRPASGGRR